MRPAGRGELDSLYFTYPKFAFVRPAEMDGETARHQVIVVGAGPVGLAAAIELARRGIRCVLLDEKDTLNNGSRAICVSRNSFETLQQLGLAARFESKALGWTLGRCYYKDRLIYRLQMPHSDHDRYLPMYNIQQQYIEQYLVDRASQFPDLIDLRWQSAVTDATNADGEVRLDIATPEGGYGLRSEYLLAADGAASLVRKKLGLRLAGENLPGRYVIADVRMDHDFPVERRSFFKSRANPDSTILVHRQPDDIWRIDWQLPPHENPDEAIAEENVHARVEAILDMLGHAGPWELEWWSIYTANTLCLDNYRHGRVLFIGDAARIVPIFGVRGLNNGFDDAMNAAWKLAYVLEGEAADELLETFTPERRGATLDIFSNAGKSSRFMTPPSRGYALMREAVLQLSLTQEFTQKFADPRQVVPYTYGDSPLTSYRHRDSEFRGGVKAGSAAINRKVANGACLLDYLGLGFTGLYFVEGENVPADIPDFSSRLSVIDHHFSLVVISRKNLPKEGFTAILDNDGRVFDAYAAKDGSFYLLRPDRHVAARWVAAKFDEVEDALKIALCRSKQ
jgi:3-(3-hydroxy-phenyl)propionate hydroxylase